MIGRAVVERLAAREHVRVVGLARRAPDAGLVDALSGAKRPVEWVRCDLQDAAATRAALASHRDTTHLVYAALFEKPELIRGWLAQDHVDVNAAMLANTFAALAGAPLAHVAMLQGTKAYGAHTGRAMRVPARERDAKRDHANFYFAQQDELEARAARANFAWTIFRPQVVLGVAVGSAMNPVAALGAYAAILRELGEPLRFPGHPHMLTECIDARIIAAAIEWSWREPRANREAINLTNGDVVVWRTFFERLASELGMELDPSPPKPGATPIGVAMPKHAATWRRLAEREVAAHPGPRRADRPQLAVRRHSLGGARAAAGADARLDDQGAPARLRRLHRQRGVHRAAPLRDARERIPAGALTEKYLASELDEDARRDTALYRWVWRWHFFAGLVVAPFLIVLALTGGLYLFEHEFAGWWNRDLVRVAASAAPLPPEQQERAVLAAYPGARVVRFAVPHAGRAAEWQVRTASGELRAVFVNPADAAVLGDLPVESRFMSVVRKLHGELLLGRFGTTLVELAACWTFILLVTGVFLWWPRGARSGGVFWPRFGATGRLLLRDLHAVPSLWNAGIVAFLVLSGLPWSGFWGEQLAQLGTLSAALAPSPNFRAAPRVAGAANVVARAVGA